MSEFNLNNKVRVKLTDHGRAVLEVEHSKFWREAGRTMPYTPPKEDADGWSEWQLWQLMSTLGGHLGLGFAKVMETTIQLEPLNANKTNELMLEINQLRSALTRIAKWHGEFPATGTQYDNGDPVSWGVTYDSNKKHDYIKKITHHTLKQNYDI